MAARAHTNEQVSHHAQDGREQAARLGELIRQRRLALEMRQDDLALTTGVGRRFIIDLEAGKPGCHLGKALLVANAVGLRLLDVMQQSSEDNALLTDLQDLSSALTDELPELSE